MADGDAIGYGAWDGYGPKIRAASARDGDRRGHHLVPRHGHRRRPEEGHAGRRDRPGWARLHRRACRRPQGSRGLRRRHLPPSSRELAAEIGLAGVAESITEFADKDLPLIVDYAGFGTTTAQAVETLGKSGTLVQVGLGRLQATVNTQALIFKQLRTFGSSRAHNRTSPSSTNSSAAELPNPPINRIAPHEIPEGLDRLRKGGAVGRIVAAYDH